MHSKKFRASKKKISSFKCHQGKGVGTIPSHHQLKLSHLHYLTLPYLTIQSTLRLHSFIVDLVLFLAATLVYLGRVNERKIDGVRMDE